MSVEENKRTVEAFFAALNDKDFDTAFTFLAPDMTWWIPTDQLGGTIVPKAQMCESMKTFFSAFVTPVKFTFNRITAEDDRVCVEMTSGGGKTPGGNVYANDYITLVRLRDGKIVEVREFFNPLLAGPVMAEFGV